MISNEEFERYVAEGIEEIPERFREKIRNVAFLIEDDPSDEVRKRESLGHDDTLLGYYTGIPNTARGSEYGMGAVLPDTITIYRQPIMALGDDDPSAVRQIVFDTVWHEVGHYLGFDEDAIQRKERERNLRRGES